MQDAGRKAARREEHSEGRWTLSKAGIVTRSAGTAEGYVDIRRLFHAGRAQLLVQGETRRRLTVGQGRVLKPEESSPATRLCLLRPQPRLSKTSKSHFYLSIRGCCAANDSPQAWIHVYTRTSASRLHA